jgi:hypothetical protein
MEREVIERGMMERGTVEHISRSGLPAIRLMSPDRYPLPPYLL